MKSRGKQTFILVVSTTGLALPFTHQCLVVDNVVFIFSTNIWQSLANIKNDFTKFLQLILLFHYFRVNFCTADNAHEKVFAYIARSNENDTMECHAFLCPKKKIVSTTSLNHFVCICVWSVVDCVGARVMGYMIGLSPN